MTGAADQLVRFEVVDQSDHRVAVDAEFVRQALLGEPVVGLQMGQDTEMRRLEPQRHETHGHPLRDVVADLGQQEHPAFIKLHSASLATAKDCHH